MEEPDGVAGAGRDEEDRTTADRSGRRHPARGPARGNLVRILLVWLGFAAACGTWSLAVPLFAAPDEPPHAVQAAAAARGDLVGRVVPSDNEYFERVTAVRVPAYWSTAAGVPVCFNFEPSVPASCMPEFVAADQGRLAEVTTTAGRYPPLYYGAVGWFSRLAAGESAMLGMRLVSACLSAVFLTIAVESIRSLGVPRVARAGVALGITPMTLFLAGSVNPNGLEIAAALACWALLLPVALAPDATQVRRRLLLGAACLAVLVNVRPSSPLWAALIGVTVLSLMTRRAWGLVTQERRALRTALTVAGVGGVLAATWLLALRPGGSLGGVPAPEYEGQPSLVARDALGTSSRLVAEMVGNFGWLDTPAPYGAVLLWVVLVGALVMLALTSAGRRAAVVLVLLVTATALAPVVLQLSSAADLGLIWQGRYTLPLAVGVPVLAGVLLAGRSAWAPITDRWATMALVGAWAASVLCLWWATRRYGTGGAGPLLVTEPAWSPPVPVAVLIAVHAVALGAALVLAGRTRLAGPSTPAGASQEHPPQGTPQAAEPRTAAGVPVTGRGDRVAAR